MKAGFEPDWSVSLQEPIKHTAANMKVANLKIESRFGEQQEQSIPPYA